MCLLISRETRLCFVQSNCKWIRSLWEYSVLVTWCHLVEKVITPKLHKCSILLEMIPQRLSWPVSDLSLNWIRSCHVCHEKYSTLNVNVLSIHSVSCLLYFEQFLYIEGRLRNTENSLFFPAPEFLGFTMSCSVLCVHMFSIWCD